MGDTEAFGLANGYAPSAHKVICVDFDSTIYPWDLVMASPDPVPGAADALRRLKDAGYRIVILTSRLSPTWLAESGYNAVDQKAHIERLLTRDAIPYDDVTSEKVPAQAYVDDRAIRFHDNWQEVAAFIMFSTSQP